MEINRTLLPIKGHFFLYWGFMASAPPFVMVLARQMGVPLNVQGIVSGVVIGAAVLARPLIAALADTFPARRKIIFLSFICLMIAAYNPLAYLPPLQHPPHFPASLVPPPTGLDTPLLVVSPPSHSPLPQDECMVTAAWDCFAFPYSIQEEKEGREKKEEESLLDIPVGEHRFSIRLLEKSLLKKLEGDENRLEDYIEGPEERKNKLKEGKIKAGEVENKFREHGNRVEEGDNETEGYQRLREGEDKFEEDQDSRTRDYKSSLLHDVMMEHGMGAQRLLGLNPNETLVYEVEGPPAWNFTNVYSVSVKCLGGDLGIVEADGTVQKGSCEPAILKEPGFWVYVLCLLVSYISATTVETISDAICCDSIGKDGHYGRQRVWGIVSYGLLGVLSGLLVDWRSGAFTVRDYRPAFLLMTACGIVDFVLSALCLRVPKLELQGKGVWTNFRPLLQRVHFLVFLITILLTGFYDGLDTGFLFVLQEDIAEKEINGSEHLNAAQGLTMLVQAITAIPFMFQGDWLVRKFSAERVMNAVLFLYAVRLVSLSAASYFEVLWCTVVVEVINGPCYGLGYTAIVIHAAALAPPGLSNTVQSLVGVCYGTLGYAGASVVGGVLYEILGGQRLYLLMGGLSLLTWILHLAHLKLCPPNIKAAKFEMGEVDQGEEPEVLQVMVGCDEDTRKATQQVGIKEELLRKEKKEKETVENGKVWEEVEKEEITKMEKCNDIAENKNEEVESVRNGKVSGEISSNKEALSEDKKAFEISNEEEKKED